MTQGRAEGDAFAAAAKLYAHGLAHQFERLEARIAIRDMDAQAAGRAVADHGEDGDLSIP